MVLFKDISVSSEDTAPLNSDSYEALTSVFDGEIPDKEDEPEQQITEQYTENKTPRKILPKIGLITLIVLLATAWPLSSKYLNKFRIHITAIVAIIAILYSLFLI